MRKYKVLIILMYLLTLIMSCLGCDSKSEAVWEDSSSAVMIETNGKTHVLSNRDTERLRDLFDAASGWVECEPCDCPGAYELILDNVRYVVDIKDKNHQIQYGKTNGVLTGAMENEDKDVVKTIYRIIEKWIELEYSYEYYLITNQEADEKAVLKTNRSGTEYRLSKEDTERLRTLFAADSGWMEQVGCECVGDYTLVLDNIKYVIDITDVTHEIKYGLAGGSAEYSMSNPNGNVVREIHRIIENALS